MTTRLLISLRNPIEVGKRNKTDSHHEGTLKFCRKMRRCGIMARSCLSYALAICFVAVVLIMGFQFFRSDSSKTDVKKSNLASYRGNRRGSYAEHPSIAGLKDDTVNKPEMKDEYGSVSKLKEIVQDNPQQQEPHEDPFFSIKKESPVIEEQSSTSSTTTSSSQENKEGAAEGSEDKSKISSTTTLETLVKPKEDEPKDTEESKDLSSKQDDSNIEPVIKKSSEGSEDELKNSSTVTVEKLDKTEEDEPKDAAQDSKDPSLKEDGSDIEPVIKKSSEGADDTLDESTKKEKSNSSDDELANTEERDVSKNYHSLKKINTNKKSYYTTEDSSNVPIKRKKFKKWTQPSKKAFESADGDKLDEFTKKEKSYGSSDDLAKEENDSSKSDISLKKTDTKEFEKSTEKADLAASSSTNDGKDKSIKDDLTAEDK